MVHYFGIEQLGGDENACCNILNPSYVNSDVPLYNFPNGPTVM